MHQFSREFISPCPPENVIILRTIFLTLSRKHIVQAAFRLQWPLRGAGFLGLASMNTIVPGYNIGTDWLCGINWA